MNPAPKLLAAAAQPEPATDCKLLHSSDRYVWHQDQALALDQFSLCRSTPAGPYKNRVLSL